METIFLKYLVSDTHSCINWHLQLQHLKIIHKHTQPLYGNVKYKQKCNLLCIFLLLVSTIENSVTTSLCMLIYINTYYQIVLKRRDFSSLLPVLSFPDTALSGRSHENFLIDSKKLRSVLGHRHWILIYISAKFNCLFRAQVVCQEFPAASSPIYTKPNFQYLSLLNT